MHTPRTTRSTLGNPSSPVHVTLPLSSAVRIGITTALWSGVGAGVSWVIGGSPAKGARNGAIFGAGLGTLTNALMPEGVVQRAEIAETKREQRQWLAAQQRRSL